MYWPTSRLVAYKHRYWCSTCLLVKVPPNNILCERRIIALLVVVFLSSGAHSKRIRTFAGPFKAILDKSYPCPENKPTDKLIMNFRSYRLAHLNALQNMEANATWLVPYLDSYWLKLKLDVWSNNQWKENALLFRFPSGACSSMRANIPNLFEKVYHQNPYSEEPCRVEPGTYVMQRQPLNLTFPNFPVIPYGTYRVSLTLGLKTEQFGCFIAESKLVPIAV